MSVIGVEDGSFMLDLIDAHIERYDPDELIDSIVQLMQSDCRSVESPVHELDDAITVDDSVYVARRMPARLLSDRDQR